MAGRCQKQNGIHWDNRLNFKSGITQNMASRTPLFHENPAKVNFEETSQQGSLSQKTHTIIIF